LTIDGTVSETGGSYGIMKNGQGRLILNGDMDYSGLTRVQSGTLEVASTCDIPSTSEIWVGAGATLEFNGNHTLDSISGYGNTVVNSGATLTVNSIVQSTLVIGSTGTAASVPEPGTLLMLCSAALGLIFAGRMFIRG
jgi:autotransporter-associated beta strand protein